MTEEKKEVLIKTFIMNKRTAIENMQKQGLDLCKSEVDSLIQGITSAYDPIYNRRKQIEGFGIIYAEGKVIDLIIEIMSCYQLGLYHATIALCGMAAERICYDFIDFSNIKVNEKQLDESTKQTLYHIPYRSMIEFLSQIGWIDEKSISVLFQINDIRNSYVHPKMTGNAEADALKVINLLCSAIENLLSMFKYYDVKDGKFVPKQ